VVVEGGGGEVIMYRETAAIATTAITTISSIVRDIALFLFLILDYYERSFI